VLCVESSSWARRRSLPAPMIAAHWMSELGRVGWHLLQVALIGSCVIGCRSESATTPRSAGSDSDTLAVSIHPCDATEVASLLCGHFASTNQSTTDREYFDVRLHMARIWPARTDAIWLYVEQAMESEPCKPYRQRIYRITERSEGDALVVVSQVFEMPDPDKFVCAWSAPTRFDALEPSLLTEREGCQITLRKTNGSWSGSTDGQSCLSSLRGATYATSEVRLMPMRIETWDRGFDAQGTQVWGARKGAYMFDRLADTPANPCTSPAIAVSTSH